MQTVTVSDYIATADVHFFVITTIASSRLWWP